MLSVLTPAPHRDLPSADACLLDAAGDVAFRVTPDGNIGMASERALRLFDVGAGSAVAATLVSLAADADQPRLRHALGTVLATLDGAQPVQVQVRLRQGGMDTWYELRIAAMGAGRGGGGGRGGRELLVIGRDMSAQRATEDRLRHLATHDPLTGLPNRQLLGDRIHMAIAQARRCGQGFSIASLGLDGFRKVNDGLGHKAGDTVLRMAADRLRRTLRDSDTLARVASDEFIAVLPGTCTDAQINLVAGRLLAAVQSAFEVDGHTIYVGASAGVAIYPNHAEDQERLVALADAALARAKETGKARCVIYSSRDARAPEHDISLEAAMFRAVREGEFMLYYQPIVDTSTREIQGFETLMRWKHPTLGMVPPVRFIPIAESNGLINLLGAWALKAACMQLRQFQEVAGRALSMSVNISPRQFRSDKFLDVLDDALAFSGLRGEQLILEITEGTLMVDPEYAEAILARMAERGTRIAIDDFGTGYSSLAYLKRFPISVLKVDRAFIKDLPQSKKDGAICNAILDLARHLDLSVVAEGVETEAQRDFLEQRGCQRIQGYLTGKPMPAHVALAALKENRYADLMFASARVASA